MATYTKPTDIDSSAEGWIDSTNNVNIFRMTGTFGISEVIENVVLDTTTSGTLNFDVKSQGVLYLTDSATSNRTINFRYDSLNTLNSIMSNGESISSTVLMTVGADSAYYLNSYLIDNDSTSLKWSGATAPSGGNTSSVDIYTFSIVKKDSANFTVFGTQSQFG